MMVFTTKLGNEIDCFRNTLTKLHLDNTPHWDVWVDNGTGFNSLDTSAGPGNEIVVTAKFE